MVGLDNPFSLAASLTVATAVGFLATLNFLNPTQGGVQGVPLLVKIYASGDDLATVFINDTEVLKVEGYIQEASHIAVWKGDKVRIVGINRGGPKGLCVQLIDTAGKLLLGTSKKHLPNWHSIDEKTGKIHKVELADNQEYAAFVSKKSGETCNALWGTFSASRTTLVATIE